MCTGMLSCQQTQNVIDGKKRIILNPSEQQRRDFETVTFAENEVYGVDILISSGEDGKVSLFACLFFFSSFALGSDNLGSPDPKTQNRRSTSAIRR